MLGEGESPHPARPNTQGRPLPAWDPPPISPSLSKAGLQLPSSPRTGRPAIPIIHRHPRWDMQSRRQTPPPLLSARWGGRECAQGSGPAPLHRKCPPPLPVGRVSSLSRGPTVPESPSKSHPATPRVPHRRGRGSPCLFCDSAGGCDGRLRSGLARPAPSDALNAKMVAVVVLPFTYPTLESSPTRSPPPLLLLRRRGFSASPALKSPLRKSPAKWRGPRLFFLHSSRMRRRGAGKKKTRLLPPHLPSRAGAGELRAREKKGGASRAAPSDE